MHVIGHHSAQQLQRLRRSAQGGLRDRIQMGVLAMEGRTAPEVAAALSSSRRTVQQWVYRYNAQSLDGLRDRRGGNHRHLTLEQEKQVCAQIDRAAADPHEGIRRGEDLRQWIHQRFGVLYTLTGVYELLHRLGYSCLMPRPRHARSDPAAQAAFKKGSSLFGVGGLRWEIRMHGGWAAPVDACVNPPARKQTVGPRPRLRGSRGAAPSAPSPRRRPGALRALCEADAEATGLQGLGADLLS